MTSPTRVDLRAPGSGWFLLARDGLGNRTLYESREDGTYVLAAHPHPESEFYIVEIRDPDGGVTETATMVEEDNNLRPLRPGEVPTSFAHRIFALEARVAALEGRGQPGPVPEEDDYVRRLARDQDITLEQARQIIRDEYEDLVIKVTGNSATKAEILRHDFLQPIFMGLGPQ